MCTPRRPLSWQWAAGIVVALLALAALDLAMQELYHRYLRPVPPRPTLPPTMPSPRPTATSMPRPTTLPPSSTPPLTETLVPTPPQYPDAQLQEAIERLAFRQLLLRSALELLRAEEYLTFGEIKQVERELVAVSATLAQASALADESLQGTMEDLQRDLSRLREDLYLRPERLREGIRRLWQRVDVLVGE